MSKIVNIKEMRRSLNLKANRDNLQGELDYRTEKLLEALDEAYQRIEKLEKNLMTLIKALKSCPSSVGPSFSEAE